MDIEVKMPEKFISIEYELWLSKYKPMEEENEKLKKQLEDRKIEIDVYANQSGRSYALYHGKIHYNFTSGWWIDGFDFNKFREAIENEFNVVDGKINDSKKYDQLYRDNYVLEQRLKVIPRWIKWLCGVNKIKSWT